MAEVGRKDRWFLPLVGLGVVSAALGVAAAGRDWATASARLPGPREVAASGADVAPLVLPLSLVALASWGAFLVLRTTGRRVVCVLGGLAAAGAVVAVVVSATEAGSVAAERMSDAEAATTTTTAWPWVAGVSLAVSVAAFALAAVRCPRWPQMSRRYDRDDATGRKGRDDSGGTGESDGTGAPQSADLWRALDDGRDPTL